MVVRAGEVWRRVMEKAIQQGEKTVVGVVDPPEAWFERFKVQFAVGLIPLEAREMLALMDSVAERLMVEMSLWMCEWMQERVRERERILDGKELARRAESKALNKKKPAVVVEVGRFGLTELEVSEVARGVVPLTWADVRTGMTATERIEKKRHMDMKGWVKRHFSTQQVVNPTSGEAASVQSLVILWEVEHGPFPSTATRFEAVTRQFSKDLKRELSEMESPYREVKTAKVRG